MKPQPPSARMSRRFYSEIIEEIKRTRPGPAGKLSEMKKRLGKKHSMKKIPSNIEIVLHGSLERTLREMNLVTKPTRTLSGRGHDIPDDLPGRMPPRQVHFLPRRPEQRFRGRPPELYRERSPPQ